MGLPPPRGAEALHDAARLSLWFLRLTPSSSPPPARHPAVHSWPSFSSASRGQRISLRRRARSGSRTRGLSTRMGSRTAALLDRACDIGGATTHANPTFAGSSGTMVSDPRRARRGGRPGGTAFARNLPCFKPPLKKSRPTRAGPACDCRVGSWRWREAEPIQPSMHRGRALDRPNDPLASVRAPRRDPYAYCARKRICSRSWFSWSA